jgi:hypothetical protein
MRQFTAATALTLGLLLGTGLRAEAREYPWCAYYDWSTYNCGFVSFRQCLATISGIGGWCQRNPRYHYRPDAEPKRRKGG